MRAAPAVVVELRCPPAWRWTQVLLTAAAALAATAAVLLHAGLSGPLLGACLALAAAAAGVAGWHGASAQAGRLRWDGGRWWFQPAGHADERAGRLHAAIDLGFWMLLRFDADHATGPAAGRAWLVFDRAAMSQAAALRAAVYSRRLNTDHPATRRREGESE